MNETKYLNLAFIRKRGDHIRGRINPPVETKIKKVITEQREEWGIWTLVAEGNKMTCWSSYQDGEQKWRSFQSEGFTMRKWRDVEER